MKECRLCKRPFTKKVLELKRKAKVANAINSANKARTVDLMKVKVLKEAGFNLREISLQLDCSYSSTQRAIRALRKSNDLK